MKNNQLKNGDELKSYTHYNFEALNVFVDEKSKLHHEILKKKRLARWDHWAKIFATILITLFICYLLFSVAQWFVTDKECSQCNSLKTNAKEDLINRPTSNSAINYLVESQEKNNIGQNSKKDATENFSKVSNSPENVSKVCHIVQQEGDKTPKVIKMDLAAQQGSIDLFYKTFKAKDLIRVVYEGSVLFDSGCVSSADWVKNTIEYSGRQNFIHIHVLPNCLGNQPETKWQIKAYCK